MRGLLRSMHKRWHFLLFAAIWGYFGFALATMQDRNSIYQYQPFTVLTLVAMIGGENILYNSYLHTMKKINFLNLILSGFFWTLISAIVGVSGVLMGKYLWNNCHIDISILVGLPLQ